MAADNPVLVRNLVDFCNELLRSSHPIRIEQQGPSEVIGDSQRHLEALLALFRPAVERHEAEPSFSSAAVVTAMAALLQDRADAATTSAAPDHRAVRQVTASAIRGAAAIAPEAVGALNVRIVQTPRRLDDLKRFRESEQQLVIAGFPGGGIILEVPAPDHRVYWFAGFKEATHSCARASQLHPRVVPVTLTSVTNAGDVGFVSDCGCLHVALKLDVDRD